MATISGCGPRGRAGTRQAGLRDGGFRRRVGDRAAVRHRVRDTFAGRRRPSGAARPTAGVGADDVAAARPAASPPLPEFPTAVRNAGLGSGLPPPLLHRLAMISSLWGFSADDAREYSAALAAGE